MSLEEGWIRSSISCLTLATGGNDSEGAWAKAIVPTENPTVSATAEMRPIQTRFILNLNGIIVIWRLDVKPWKAAEELIEGTIKPVPCLERQPSKSLSLAAFLSDRKLLGKPALQGFSENFTGFGPSDMKLV
jgi:hypothetical protein